MVTVDRWFIMDIDNICTVNYADKNTDRTQTEHIIFILFTPLPTLPHPHPTPPPPPPNNHPPTHPPKKKIQKEREGKTK